MLIWKEEGVNGNPLIELHHLGRLALKVQVLNPDPKDKIPEDSLENMTGVGYYDGFSFGEVRHDFYFIYERLTKPRVTTKKVSFTRPVTLLKKPFVSNEAILRGLSPSQHPAVTHYIRDEELCAFGIAGEAFYDAEFERKTYKRTIKRKVLHRFSQGEGGSRPVEDFLPPKIKIPLLEVAPAYVLEVLDLP